MGAYFGVPIHVWTRYPPIESCAPLARSEWIDSATQDDVFDAIPHGFHLDRDEEECQLDSHAKPIGPFFEQPQVRLEPASDAGVLADEGVAPIVRLRPVERADSNQFGRPVSVLAGGSSEQSIDGSFRVVVNASEGFMLTNGKTLPPMANLSFQGQVTGTATSPHVLLQAPSSQLPVPAMYDFEEQDQLADAAISTEARDAVDGSKAPKEDEGEAVLRVKYAEKIIEYFDADVPSSPMRTADTDGHQILRTPEGRPLPMQAAVPMPTDKYRPSMPFLSPDFQVMQRMAGLPAENRQVWQSPVTAAPKPAEVQRFHITLPRPSDLVTRTMQPTTGTVNRFGNFIVITRPWKTATASGGKVNESTKLEDSKLSTRPKDSAKSPEKSGKPDPRSIDRPKEFAKFPETSGKRDSKLNNGPKECAKSPEKVGKRDSKLNDRPKESAKSPEKSGRRDSKLNDGPKESAKSPEKSGKRDSKLNDRLKDSPQSPGKMIEPEPKESNEKSGDPDSKPIDRSKDTANSPERSADQDSRSMDRRKECADSPEASADPDSKPVDQSKDCAKSNGKSTETDPEPTANPPGEEQKNTQKPSERVAKRTI